MQYCIILLTFFLALSNLYGQKHSCIEKFRQLKKNNIADTTKIRLLVETGNCYYLSFNPDSAEIFFLNALNLIENSNDKTKENKNINEYNITALRKIGDIAFDISQFDKALKYYRKALDIAIKHHVLTDISTCLNNIAIVYHYQSRFDSAITFYFKALKIDEQLNDKKGIATRYNNIGNVYYAQKNFDKALEYYEKSLKIKEQLNDSSGISFSYLNIGAVWYSQKKFDKALEYFNKSLQIKKMLNDLAGVIVLYNNIGLIYRQQKQYQKAIETYLSSLDLAKELNDRTKMAMINENIASVYLFYAQELKDKHKAQDYFKKSIEYSEKALEISKTIKSYEYISASSNSLFRSYFGLGDYQKGLEYLELFLQSQDSIFNQNQSKAIAEAEKKFEAEKKQLIIDNLTKEKQLNDLEIQRQKIIIWSIVLVLILSLIFAFFMINRYKTIKRQKHIIEKQKMLVDEKNILLNKQNEEIKAQHELVLEQKKQIEDYNKKLTDSITYAKRIQEAILPNAEECKKLLGSHFIIFKPKDIVSGDFYWFTQINEWLIIAVADCTGHGVPGAFMSMLGVSLLNEIVHKKEVTLAAQALEMLRTEIIYALKQKDTPVSQKDGMDISLLVINKKTYECQWAGANNPLYIIQKQQLNLINGTHELNNKINKIENPTTNNYLYEITPDKMPIAIYPKMNSFTNFEFKLEKGSRIYLTSDGYADQFGMNSGKKFLHKRLKQLLLDSATSPLHLQKDILEKSFIEWKGSLEQTDDVTLIGIEI